MDRYTQLALKMDRLQLHRHALIRKEMAAIGLYRGQTALLNYIIENDGCTQAKLAEDMGLSAASIAISTKRLEKVGLLRKMVDGKNLRCNKLSITPLGREKTKAGKSVVDALNQMTFKGFSESERAQLEEFLDRLIENTGGEAKQLEPFENFVLANRMHRKGEKEC